MQGRQNAANLERKGPHKSMHCKFCKPPGAVVVEKPSGPQLETKTRIHLVHEGADLRLSNIQNEPGLPTVESEACMCILEGENPCPKCAPDKTRPPLKKKVCRCPKGAKPHPSMFNQTAPKKKKLKEEDDEFWWEKYSREHDATAKETWAAYMAQRRKDKKVIKCQNEELERLILNMNKNSPYWYQKLSCQQATSFAENFSKTLRQLQTDREHSRMIYVEFLSTAIRLDSDENITDRTEFILGGIGLYPRPSRKFVKKCLRYCHYNAVQFLNQLHLLTKDLDPFEEKRVLPSVKKNVPILYTWNEKLIMSCICYLEFPAILRELMDRLPPLPRDEILPQIPYPAIPLMPKKKFDNPYEEPIWQDRLNWSEKMKIDRINRCRAHMETKRVKIPPLALVRRPSLIDARPPFLAQIEANERASRRMRKEKKKRPMRKHPISTFNSAVDVTAIAGIEASEISTTDKADTDDICVFLREPKESESTEEAETEEESDFPLPKEVKFLESEGTSEIRKKPLCDMEDTSLMGEGDVEDIPFKTPPKTESGVTVASPCPPPEGTPGPPAHHFESGKRELGIINEEICRFFPFVSSSRQTIKETVDYESDGVELKLKSAAAKLKKLTENDTDAESKKHRKKKNKNLKKKGRCKKKRNKKGGKNRSEVFADETTTLIGEKKEEEEEGEEEEEEEEDEDEEIEDNYTLQEDDLEEGDDIKLTYKKRGKYTSSRDSEISDPDPETDDEWPTRLPCTPDASQFEEQIKPRVKRKLKRKGKILKKKPRKKKASKGKNKEMELQEETGVYMKKRESQDMEEANEGTTENLEKLNEENQETKIEGTDEKQEGEEKEKDVFRGEIEPLVKEIIQDLAEEGFCCASYPNVDKHPDVLQLVLHLKGKILNKSLRKKLFEIIKVRWDHIKQPERISVPELGLPKQKLWLANWNDKKLISKLAKLKLDQFYYKVARFRAESGGEIYKASYQHYFGTDSLANPKSWGNSENLTPGIHMVSPVTKEAVMIELRESI